MNVLKEIASWAKGQASWLSDAVRRLLLQSELTERDREEVLVLLKKESGIEVLTEDEVIAKPVSDKEFSGPEGESRKVILKELHDLKHVNALAQGQSLCFSENGLTIIYGRNASGKSGYSRVLKRACHSREQDEKVLPNVFSTQEGVELPTAHFAITVDGNEVSIEWSVEDEPPELLSDISVFDSKCTRVIVDKANAAIYLPYGLDIFEKLVDLCNWMKERIQEEIEEIERITESIPTFEKNTVVGRFIHEMNPSTTVEEIEKNSVVTETDKQREEEIRKRLADLILNDPRKKGEKLSKLRSRIGELKTDISESSSFLSDASLGMHKEQWDRTQEAIKLSRFATEEAFKDEPLQGVGSEPWKKMFQAAIRYSEEIAYVGEEFPFIGDEARCVLCQQELIDDNAKTRLKRFKDSVQEDFAKREAEENKLLSELKDRCRRYDIDFEKKYEDLAEQIKDIDQRAAEAILSHLKKLTIRAKITTQAFETGAWEDATGLGTESIIPLIEELLGQIGKMVSEAEEESVIKEKEELEGELEEIEDKKKLKENIETMRDYLEKLKKKELLSNCKTSTRTTGISRKAKELTELAVTKELEEALKRELLAIGMDYLKLEFESQGVQGEAKHRIILSSQCQRAEIAQVLSEGEQCAVAIASFMAELGMSGHEDGIILDDPVCSLDHQFEKSIAERLAEEAAKRQVIIFTHDIVFLMALEAGAEMKGIPVSVMQISRQRDVAGLCESELPWITMNTGQRIGYLRKLAQDAEAKLNRGETAEYEVLARQCYSKMRETWERAIEEVLFGDVIARFRPDIQTRRLKDVSIEDSDIEKVEQGMTKCSGWIDGHDQAAGLDIPPPSPNELKQDIESIKKFVDEARSRQEEKKKSRKAGTSSN